MPPQFRLPRKAEILSSKRPTTAAAIGVIATGGVMAIIAHGVIITGGIIGPGLIGGITAIGAVTTIGDNESPIIG
jgi:hypothetical protein